MQIYIVVANDRHFDPAAYVFSKAEDAIHYAKILSRSRATDELDVEEDEIEGWLYYARYSVEGDATWVVEAELDSHLP